MLRAGLGPTTEHEATSCKPTSIHNMLKSRLPAAAVILLARVPLLATRTCILTSVLNATLFILVNKNCLILAVVLIDSVRNTARSNPDCFLKKALITGAFFVGAGLFDGSPAIAACQLQQAGEPRQVTYVVDGDTVHLDSRPNLSRPDQKSRVEKIRFVGINTPELARQSRPSEPLAEQARQFVIDTLDKNANKLILQKDQESLDRYGRTLAHVWLDPNHSLSEALLENGLASLLVIPPNTLNLDCYRAAEQRARESLRGIWQLPGFTPIAARNVTPKDRGYRIITGKVVRVGQSKKSIWLNLDGPVAIRIARSDLRYFNEQDLLNSRGSRIIVRGWSHPYKKKAVIRLRHPVFMERQ